MFPYSVPNNNFLCTEKSPHQLSGAKTRAEVDGSKQWGCAHLNTAPPPKALCLVYL